MESNNIGQQDALDADHDHKCSSKTFIFVQARMLIMSSMTALSTCFSSHLVPILHATNGIELDTSGCDGTMDTCHNQ